MAQRIVVWLLLVAVTEVVVVAAAGGVPRTLLDTSGVSKWVAPPGPDDPDYSTAGCDSACAKSGGAWRHFNGGSADFAMCAGLIDMPGLGKKWLVGRTPKDSAVCEIACVTNPCWNVPAGATTDFDFVTAGAANVYTASNGNQETVHFPVKCACTNCVGAACDGKWCKRAGAGVKCPKSAILSAYPETYPKTVYSNICRSDEPYDGTLGYTGWVDTRESPPVCRGTGMAADQYSLLCN